MIFFAVYFIVEVTRNKSKTKILRPFLSVSFGFLLPFVALLTMLWQNNTFDRFYYFVVQYAREYTKLSETKYFPFAAFSNVFTPLEWFWREATVATLFIISHIFFRKTAFFSTPHNPALLLLFFLCAYAAVLPGGYLRPHYFMYLNPAVALLAGYGLACFRLLCLDNMSKMTYFLILTLSTRRLLYTQLPDFCRWRDGDYVNVLYGGEHFNEMQEIGNVIKLNAQKEDKIGIACPEPQLGFIQTYDWRQVIYIRILYLKISHLRPK
ncbi:MAG: hypothetical protein HC817_01775 [Saprospiraceae bacterium]|nr:hypothetical protein [Saprospiraceae bacterium]